MTEADVVSGNRKLALNGRHKKSLTQISLTDLSINDNNPIIDYNTDASYDENKLTPKPIKKKQKNDLQRKRKSEAAIHSAKKFPSTNGHNKHINNSHSNTNGSQKQKKVYRHSHCQMSQVQIVRL